MFFKKSKGASAKDTDAAGQGVHSENPRFDSSDPEANPENARVEDEDDDHTRRRMSGLRDEDGEVPHYIEEKPLFLLTLEEKRKVHKEFIEEAMEELKEFHLTSSVRKAEMELELSVDMENFLKKASRIVKQTREMDEAHMLEKLGLEEVDTFDGEFTLNQVKNGTQLLNEVSNIFRPRLEVGKVGFHPRGEEFAIPCLQGIGCVKEKPNYDPLTEREFRHWQKNYPGLRKILGRKLVGNESTLDISKAWFGDDITMKLLAEYVWRNLESISIVDAEGSEGWNKRDSLVFMQALIECPNLTAIDFDHGHLGTEGSAALALVAKTSMKLEAITLKYSKTRDAGALFWGLALASGCPSLKTLNLSNAEIGPAGATAIAIGLSQHQQLRVLNLSNNKIDRPGCQRIGEALLVNPILDELNLSGCSIGSRGASSIAAFVIHPSCQIKTLILKDNDIGPRGGKALAVALAFNKSLLTLDMSMNDCGDIGIAGFGTTLQRNSTLKYLDISDCDMTDVGAASVAYGLHKNVGLRSLKMSTQVIGDAGCAHIAKQLGGNPASKLRSLDLSINVIRDAGATSLSELLKNNTSLTEIILSDNEIQDEGAIALAKVLESEQNKTLKSLDVSQNPISLEVAREYFAQAERRLIQQSTARLDVVAQGTSMARGNLRGCGVIVMRSEISWWYALIYGVASFFSGWINMASDILVSFTTVTAAYTSPSTGSIIYAFLTVTFLVLPYIYILFMFSLPPSETDATDPKEESEHLVKGKSKNQTDQSNLHSSSLMFGLNYGPDESGSFSEHFFKITSAGCDANRWFLFVLNATVTRIPYEVYLSYRQGLTTLAFGSIRLAKVIFASAPGSIVQLHILFSEPIIAKIQTNGSLVKDGDYSALVLVISVAFSVSMLASTLSGLYEEKAVVNWKRVALANEDLAYWIGYFLSYFYHFTHFLFRAITTVLIASVFSAPVALAFFAFGILLRVMIWKITQSERRLVFAIVSYIVGVASWDTRRASRFALMLEMAETVIVIPPLWMSVDTIVAEVSKAPLVFQLNWLSLVQIVGPTFFTVFLYVNAAISVSIYLLFIERIHPYRDVNIEVDEAYAMELAMDPFDEHSFKKRKARFGFGFLSSGSGLMGALSGSLMKDSSTLKSSGSFLFTAANNLSTRFLHGNNNDNSKNGNHGEIKVADDGSEHDKV